MKTDTSSNSVLFVSGSIAILCVVLFVIAESQMLSASLLGLIQLLALVICFTAAMLRLITPRRDSRSRIGAIIAVVVCGVWLVSILYFFLTFDFPPVG